MDEKTGTVQVPANAPVQGGAEATATKAPFTPKVDLPKEKKPRTPIPIKFNSPVILGFAALSLVALLLGLITGGATNTLLFSTYRTSALDPLGFVRMFTYVLGHADFQHWITNITLLLIVGPLIEEKYGSIKTLLLILITAFVTAVFNNLLFSTGLMGASGIVFAMILLSSFASYERGSIPLTLIIVAVIFIAHIFGGPVGRAAGFFMNRKASKKGKKK